MTDTLDERLLVREAVVSCERCPLHESCTAPVPFVGMTPNDIVVVGEAPGKTEDREGKPFVGMAGEMIRSHLTDVGFIPENLGWLNTVSCYPNGTPKPEHIKACAVNKDAQLDLFDPKWVLLLGSVALKPFRSDLTIGNIHGYPFNNGDGRVYFPTYHPAYALRNSKGEAAMHADLVTFKAMIDSADPISAIPDRCVKCDELPCFYGEDYIPWGNCGRMDCGLPEEMKTRFKPEPLPTFVELRQNLDASERVVLMALKSQALPLTSLTEILHSNQHSALGVLEDLRRDGWVVSPKDSNSEVWALSHRGRTFGPWVKR